MKFCCVISPDSRSLVARLEGNTGGFEWFIFDCDITTEDGLKNVITWLEEMAVLPQYVLVGLTSFDENNCENEKRLSDYLQSKEIPTQFLLHEALGIHNVQAIAMSAKTGITDLWSCPLRGAELLQMIVAYIKVAKEPVLARGSTALM